MNRARPSLRAAGLVAVLSCVFAGMARAQVGSSNGDEEFAAQAQRVSELSGNDINELALAYVIEAPIEDVWDFYTFTDLNKFWDTSVISSQKAICPDLKRTYEPETLWPELRTGMQFQNRLLWLGVPVPLDMEITAIEPLRVIEFQYMANSPAAGTQRLYFESIKDDRGRSVTKLTHVSYYRGRNAVSHLLYPAVHKTIFNSLHLHAKFFLERSSWAARYCDSSTSRDGTFDTELRWIRDNTPIGKRATPETLRQALCLFSRLHTNYTGFVPKSDEEFDRTVGAFAAALDAGDPDFYQQELKKEEEAREVAVGACR